MINGKTQEKTSKICNAWAIACNPLANLTQSKIRNLFTQYRLGNDVQLQVAFNDVEKQMPIFGICINKRCAAVANKPWQITPIDGSTEAKNQANVVQKMLNKSLEKNVDGFMSAIRHLVLASFRGRACVKPFIVNDELIFKKIQNWNTLFINDRLYFNPDCLMVFDIDKLGHLKIELPEITEDEAMFIVDDRPIDIPGIQIYLRQLIGEDNWARFIEKSGVPQVIITAPEGIPEDQLGMWQARALQIFEGASGTLSHGSDLKVLTEGRGQDPFSAYVDHQMELICLLALGEKMTTLGGSAGLGSKLAEIQSDEFYALVKHDAERIQNTINACLIPKIIKHYKYDQMLCKFEFYDGDKIKAAEYVDMAVKLHDLGITIDAEKLKELTNLGFINTDIKDVWKPGDNE